MVLVGVVDFDVTFFVVGFVVLVGAVDFDVTFVVGFVVLVGAVDFDVTLCCRLCGFSWCSRL